MALYHVPGMGVKEVHPEDEARADSLGWKRAQPMNVEGTAPPRTWGELGGEYHGQAKGLARMLPTAGAMGLSMMVPGAPLAAPLLTRLALAGASMGAAGAGGMGGEAIRRGVSGEPMDPRGIVQEGARQMAFAAPGEALGHGAQMLAIPIARSAWRMSPTAQKEAGANMTELARDLYPEGEQLWVSALKERVPPNSRLIGHKIGAESKKKTAAIGRSVQRGDEFTAFDVIRESGMPEVRAELAKSKHAKPLLEELDQRIADFVSQRRLKPNKPNQMGKMRRYNAEEFAEELRRWQDEASSIYDKAARGGDVPATKEFDRAIPYGGRRALEAKAPEVAAINARLQRLGRLSDQSKNVERMGGIWLPMLGGTVAATGSDGDVADRAKNALMAGLALRGLTSPTLQGMTSLGLTNRGVQRGMREAPRWLLPWMFPNESPPTGGR